MPRDEASEVGMRRAPAGKKGEKQGGMTQVEQQLWESLCTYHSVCISTVACERHA